jgi:hypothetical protein
MPSRKLNSCNCGRIPWPVGDDFFKSAPAVPYNYRACPKLLTSQRCEACQDLLL